MKRGKGGVSGIVVVFPTVRVGIRAVQYTHITTKCETNFFLPLVHSTHRACSACTSLIRRRAVGGDGERIGWQGPNTNERRRRSATASSQQPVVDPGRRCNHPPPPITRVDRVSTHRPVSAGCLYHGLCAHRYWRSTSTLCTLQASVSGILPLKLERNSASFRHPSSNVGEK